MKLAETLNSESYSKIDIAMKYIRIGMIGCGTVGAGVVRCLEKNAELIRSRCGVSLTLARVAVKDLTKKRPDVLDESLLTDDPYVITNDPAIDVVVELIGGTEVAKTVVLNAIAQGKPVVTANKALLARHGDEIFTAAVKQNTDVFYEASTGGGIPIIKVLREGLAANHITRIYGILNGTCNYILTRMEVEEIDFAEVLADAQKLGYAEADPSLDIDGIDTAHKISILASLAYGQWLGQAHIHVEGIRGLDLQDIRNAAEAGYKIKLLGIVKLDSGNIQLCVYPTLVPTTSLIAQINNVNNGVWVSGDIVGDTLYYGPGAGADATASAVVADLIDVALNLKCNSSLRIDVFRPHQSYNQIISMAEIRTRYYLRLSVLDKPQVMARITRILGDLDISIASVIQRESDLTTLPVIIITHEALEANMMDALQRIKALDFVSAPPVLIRIEDL